ncbi:MAG: hypothetical protein QM654_00105 [Dysgonamonadaceae bacterium]
MKKIPFRKTCSKCERKWNTSIKIYKQLLKRAPDFIEDQNAYGFIRIKADCYLYGGSVFVYGSFCYNFKK